MVKKYGVLFQNCLSRNSGPRVLAVPSWSSDLVFLRPCSSFARQESNSTGLIGLLLPPKETTHKEPLAPHLAPSVLTKFFYNGCLDVLDVLIFVLSSSLFVFSFFLPFLVLFAVAEHLPCSSQDRNLDLSACLHIS